MRAYLIVILAFCACKPRKSELSSADATCVGLADCSSAFTGTHAWKMDLEISDGERRHERFLVVARRDSSSPYTFEEIVNEWEKDALKRSRFLRGTMSIVNNAFIVLHPQSSSCGKIPKHARIDRSLRRLNADRLLMKTTSAVQDHAAWLADRQGSAGFVPYVRQAAAPQTGVEACF